MSNRILPSDNSGRPYYVFHCSSCKKDIRKDRVIEKILSIMYRPKTLNIQLFKNIKCPECGYLVTIIYETLDCSVVK